MASNKTGIDNLNTGGGKDLGSTLLKIVAYGVAGGALLISGAKQLGEALLDKQGRDQTHRGKRSERAITMTLKENDQ